MIRVRSLAVIIMIILFSGILFAEPSLAVLDAILEEGLDPAIRVPITEKIIEQAVASKKYVVLDRANITQVLSEKEFQFSGLVKDTEIKKAGEYIGADFVGVARVSIVGETYFISAKIINVETGAITAQASAEKKGDSDVVFDLAQTVGVKLMGGVLTPEEEAVIVDEEQPEEEPRQSRLFAAGAEKTGARSRVVVSFLYPVYMGSGLDLADEIHDADGIIVGWFSDWWAPAFGIDVHYLQVFLQYFYASVSLSYSIRNFETETPSYYFAKDFDTFDGQIHVGGIYSLFPNFQVYGGAGVGYLKQSLGDYWIAEWAEDAGITISIEAGADYILGGFLSLSARVSFSFAPVMSAWEIYAYNESFGYFGLQVGAGFAY